MRDRDAGVLRATFVLSLLLHTSLSIAVPAEAQELRGRVLDEELRTPVLVGSALLLDYTGRVREVAVTDSAGTFAFALPEQGGFFGVRIDAAGYAMLLVPPFEVAPGETVEFDALVGYSQSRVDPESIRRYVKPELNGFRQRRR